MRTRVLSAVVVISLCVLSSREALAYGESVAGFPNWEERTILQLTNRARVAPTTELAGCTQCNSAELQGCYSPVTALTHSAPLNESARFHAAYMAAGGSFAHNTACTIRTDIAAAYPDTCNGAPSCACSTSGTTSWNQRVSLFGGSGSAENIAYGYPTPHAVFYGWLHEPAPSGTCGFGMANGHRWSILRNGGPSVGGGFASNRWVQDFGSGPTAASVRIPSGSHWTSSSTRQGATIEFWANWVNAAAPASFNVVVDGQTFPLTLSRGTGTNGAWTTSRTNLGTGCHRYYFSARDSSGAEFTYPTTGSFGIGALATCEDWSATRSGGVGKDDFNRDGRDDVIWRNSATGANSFWFLDGVRVAGGTTFNPVADVNWKVAGTGDFNLDGSADILWHHQALETNTVWYMSGSAFSSTAAVQTAPAGWRPAAVGDLDGNGRVDIVLRHSLTGRNSVWFMNNTSMVSTAELTAIPTLTWSLSGAGDVNGDGKSDLIWWDQATGSLVVWLMNGATSQSVYIGGVSDTLWRVGAVGDYNGDGKADVLWNHATTGSVAVWFLNGAAVTGGGFVGATGDANWSVVGSR